MRAPSCQKHMCEVINRRDGERERAVCSGDKSLNPKEDILVASLTWQLVYFYFIWWTNPFSLARLLAMSKAPVIEDLSRRLNHLLRKKILNVWTNPGTTDSRFYLLKRHILWKELFYYSYFYLGYMIVSPDELLKIAGVRAPPQTNEIWISASTPMFS